VRQTGGQADIQTDRQVDIQTDRQTGRRTDIQARMQAGRRLPYRCATVPSMIIPQGLSYWGSIPGRGLTYALRHHTQICFGTSLLKA
jgi:hypothetical protein